MLYFVEALTYIFVIQAVPIGVLAVLFMILMGIVFLFPTTPQTSVQEMNYTVAVLGGVMLLSVIWYYFPKYGGVHWFKGPVSNIDIRTPSINSDSEKAAAQKV